jgi:two-component system sensor histidine kinase and response regulator WspE
MSEENKEPTLNIDETLLELFRAEVEEHGNNLSHGLLELEEKTSKELLEKLMRASHSIKGAARVIGLKQVVDLAHSLENLFVAAQQGKIVIKGEMVDKLLPVVDLLLEMKELDNKGTAKWLEVKKEPILAYIATLEALLAGDNIVPAPAPVPVCVPVPEIKDKAGTGTHTGTETIPLPEKKEESSDERFLRVRSSTLDQLLGLAGESVVENQFLKPFVDSLIHIKMSANELEHSTNMLRDHLSGAQRDKKSDFYLRAVEHLNLQCQQNLGEALAHFDGYIRRHARLSDKLYRETINTRMRPFGDGVGGLERMVRDLKRSLNKQVHFEILGKETLVDRDILDKLEAPLGHLLRNALDHGIETPEERTSKGKSPEGHLKLEARHRAGMLTVTVTDDGRGIDGETIRKKVVEKGLVNQELASKLSKSELLDFLFIPGFSTKEAVTDVSGRGVGLDVVLSMVHEVGGTLKTHSDIGEGMSCALYLPLTLSVIKALLVTISGELYAFPLSRLERIAFVSNQELFFLGGKQFFSLNHQNIAVFPAHQLFGLEKIKTSPKVFPVIVLADRRNELYGIAVEEVVGERELVIQALDRRLGKIRNISCGAVLEDGRPILVIDTEDLVQHAEKTLKDGGIPLTMPDQGEMPRKKVLIVDDSMTVREVEHRLLHNAGYEVHSAVDGMDGLNSAQSNTYDLIITDIDMPRMNGIEFMKILKQSESLKKIPIIVISYKDTEKDRQEGLQAGADCYLTKSSFQDETFLKMVRELIGKAVL